MSKQSHYRASAVASGIGAVLVMAWAATGAPWAMWGGCAAVATAVGFLLGGYIEVEED